MKVQSQVDLKENAQVLLKITVPEADVKKEYNELVKEYCGKIVIKGFRKGKVPPDILIRKYGDALKQETTQNVIKKSLEQTFESIEHKPLSFAPPEIVDEIKLEFGKDFSFQVTYDTYPQITLGQYKDLKIEKAQVSIREQDIERELKILQERNSVVKEKQGDTVERGDIVTIDYVELDEKKNEVSETKREAFVFEVGTGNNIYKIDNDLIGMKRGTERVITKSYDQKDPDPYLSGKELNLKVKLTALRTKIIPELDDELAKDISDKYKTLADLKSDLKQKLEKQAEESIKQIMIGKLIEKIVKDSKIPLPKSLLEAELNAQWQNFIIQNRTDEKQMHKALAKSNKTKEDIFNEWKPKVIENLKSRLILEEIIKQEKIEADDSEVEAEIQKYADKQALDFKTAKETYEKMNMISVLKNSITREKAFNILIENAKKEKGAKIKFVDLVKGNY